MGGGKNEQTTSKSYSFCCVPLSLSHHAEGLPFVNPVQEPRQLSPTPQFLNSDVWHFQLFEFLLAFYVYGSPNLLSGIFQERVTSAHLRCNPSRLQKSLPFYRVTALLAITSEHTANTWHHGNGQAQNIGKARFYNCLSKVGKATCTLMALACLLPLLGVLMLNSQGFLGDIVTYIKFQLLVKDCNHLFHSNRSCSALPEGDLMLRTSHLMFIWGEGSGSFGLQVWFSLKQQRSKPAPRNPQGSRTART